jgi:hypothetical protein
VVGEESGRSPKRLDREKRLERGAFLFPYLPHPPLEVRNSDTPGVVGWARRPPPPKSGEWEKGEEMDMFPKLLHVLSMGTWDAGAVVLTVRKVLTGGMLAVSLWTHNPPVVDHGCELLTVREGWKPVPHRIVEQLREDGEAVTPHARIKVGDTTYISLTGCRGDKLLTS